MHFHIRLYFGRLQTERAITMAKEFTITIWNNSRWCYVMNVYRNDTIRAYERATYGRCCRCWCIFGQKTTSEETDWEFNNMHSHRHLSGACLQISSVWSPATFPLLLKTIFAWDEIRCGAMLWWMQLWSWCDDWIMWNWEMSS